MLLSDIKRKQSFRGRIEEKISFQGEIHREHVTGPQDQNISPLPLMSKGEDSYKQENSYGREYRIYINIQMLLPSMPNGETFRIFVIDGKGAAPELAIRQTRRRGDC